MLQIEHPKKNDWASQALKDLKQIGFRIEDLENMSSLKFKDIVKEKVKCIAFDVLQNKKQQHEKVRHIKYKKLEMQGYLKPTNLQLSVKERQYLFQ